VTKVYSFQVVETFLDGPVNLLAGITDLEIVQSGGVTWLYSATRAGGGIVALNVGAQMTLIDQEVTATNSVLPAPARLEFATVNGYASVIVMGASMPRMGGFRLGTDGGFSTAVGINNSPPGVVSAQTMAVVAGETLCFTSNYGQSSIRCLRLAANGEMTALTTLTLGPNQQGIDITSMITLQSSGQLYLAATSRADDAIVLFRVGAGGVLQQTGTIGEGGGLGIADPSDVRSVVMGGVTYLLVAAGGTSSISVVAVQPDGSLLVTDHIGDTLDTRFQGVQTLATVVVGDRIFVIAGGGDDGLNLFTLLPDGKLLLVASQLQAPGLGLHNITAIEALNVSGVIEVFVAGEGLGITRLRLDPGLLSPMLVGGALNDTLVGGAAGDLLSGGAGQDSLNGGSGNDILMDGTGMDTLSGGAGLDVFVLTRDGADDVILDYQVGVDRLDLTAWGRVYSVDALSMVQTATGAIISFLGEVLVVQSANGQPINLSAFLSSDLFGLWHIGGDNAVAGVRLEGLPGVETLQGGAGDDVLVGSTGADLLDGGAGFDFVDYSEAGGSQRIDLLYPTLNTLLAIGDRHISVEGVIGGYGPDNIRGTYGDNVLRGEGDVDYLFGRRGNDVLDGGIGDDVLFGGVGADTLIGGTGRDRAQYSESTAALVVDMQFMQYNTGEAVGDVYSGIEGVAGSSFNDTLFGDSYANQLYGRDGADALIGRGGHDYLNGGAGADTLNGGADNDTLRGGTHADTFVFNAGRDVIEDFRLSDLDRLSIEDGLYGGGLSAEQVIAAYAAVVGSAVVFDFGNSNTLTLQGISTLAGLAGLMDLV
jgi:Ca2+-binding RTX toxin-like protein